MVVVMREKMVLSRPESGWRVVWYWEDARAKDDDKCRSIDISKIRSSWLLMRGFRGPNRETFLKRPGA